MTTLQTHAHNEREARADCRRLAQERGYHDNVRLYCRRVVLLTRRGVGEEVDYVAEVLAPRGLAPFSYQVKDWQDARRLLGLLPPAR